MNPKFVARCLAVVVDIFLTFAIECRLYCQRNLLQKREVTKALLMAQSRPVDQQTLEPVGEKGDLSPAQKAAAAQKPPNGAVK